MENNFEKEVRQRMEELSLPPSAPVWEAVHAAIRRRHDRRRALLWLLPLLLLGGGITYLFFENNQPAPLAVEQPGKGPAHHQTKQVPPLDQVPLQETNDRETRSKQSGPNTAPAVESSNTVEKNTDRSAHTTALKRQPVVQARGKRQNADASVGPATEERIRNTGHPAVKPGTAEQEGAPSQATPAPPASDFIPEETELVPSRVRRILIGETQPVIKLAEPAGYFVPDTITLQPVLQVKRIATPDWQWGLTARGGASGTGNLDFSAVKADRARLSMDPTTTTGPASVRRPPAEPQQAFAFSAGAFVKRNLSSRAWLEAGLQYSYYGTRMTVGTKRTDTAVSSGFSNIAMRVESYYRNDGATTTHTNQLHFVELPLKFGYRPLKNLPLQLQHGLTAGRYISGSHLQYNATANIYYESAESLRKMQWHLLTSIDYRIVNAKRFAAYAGPELQYGLRSLKDDGSSNRLFFGGLKTRFEF